MTRPCRLNLMPLLTLLLAAAPAAQACGACGCTLNSDWASQGYALKPGLRFDLRQDYFNQDQLRAGTRSMGRGALDFPNDQEIQEQTLNRNTTLTLDYSPTVDWGVALVRGRHLRAQPTPSRSPRGIPSPPSPGPAAWAMSGCWVATRASGMTTRLACSSA